MQAGNDLAAYPLDLAAHKSLIEQADILPRITGLHRLLLAACVQLKHYRRGDIIFKQGDMGDCLHIILEGEVSIYMAMDHGNGPIVTVEKGHLIAVLGRGKLLGEMACLDSSPRSATAKAVRSTTTFALDMTTFTRLRAEFPALALNLLLIELSDRVRESNIHSQILAAHEANQRLARFLLYIAEDRGVERAEGTIIPLDINQKKLASMLGLAEETLGRTLRKLIDDKLIRRDNNREIILREMAKLKRLANGGE